MLTTKAKKQVALDIAKFKRTGKLPKERDVRRDPSYNGWDDNAGASYIEPGPDRNLDPYGQAVHLDQQIEKEPILSEEAAIFAERQVEFQAALSKMEQSVFSLHLVGQMSRKETADILGVSQQRIAELLGLIKKKAGRFTKEKLSRVN